MTANLVDIVRATRPHESILAGAGPRAVPAVIRLSLEREGKWEMRLRNPRQQRQGNTHRARAAARNKNGG